jgi:hypothetical protein
VSWIKLVSIDVCRPFLFGSQLILIKYPMELDDQIWKEGTVCKMTGSC